ncbi:MAG: response regulator transcription factor [Nitrospira sp.]|nr:response regulator transcription factor [Nitrospira sp.]MDR4465439.1 response regulator transcription factor [Nitrospira sp.]
MKPRILIADDHLLVAEGIQKLLESDAEVAGILADGRSLVRAVTDTHPDLIIIDISLPLLNGLDAARQIKQLDPKIKMLMLTMHADQAFVVEAFRVGVAGYVLKQSLSNELQHAVREVLKGNTYISPSVAQGLVEHMNRPAQVQDGEAGGKRFDHALSPRQREVLQLVAEGRSTKEIASILNVSTKTVEFHRTRIMKELGLKTRPELTKYAIANGIITVQAVAPSQA